MNKMDLDFLRWVDLHIVAELWLESAMAQSKANTAWREHVATLDVAREYWG